MGSDEKVIVVEGPIIIGGGPSGLAVAACLKQNGVAGAVILERSDCIASLWQQRTYDRLKLHLPKQFCQLPLMNFPGDFPKYPSKRQFISYMEAYADRLYRSGSEFKNQRVLVVGCGNSGMEVSLDLCRHNASPHMVVRNSVHILPREMFGVSSFTIAMGLLKWLPLRLVDKLLLLVANLTFGKTELLGIRRPKTGPIELKKATGKTPVLDVGALSLIKSGKIKVMEGVREITRNGAKFVDGQEREFDSIILATGLTSLSSYTCSPRLQNGCDFFTEEEGMPKTPFPNWWKGENGLYTVGFTRRGLLGTSSDAMNIARDLAEQWRLANTTCTSIKVARD
nr:probable indole-3-pyruvate monooxygenase YUCCA4 [Ipomoea batatas]